MKEVIKAYAKSIGINAIGVTSAEPFFDIEERLRAQYAKGYISGFEEKDIEKRIYPQVTMPEAQSIIAIAMAYPSKIGHGKDQKRRGYFSSSSYGKDYHGILYERMEKLSDFITQTYGAKTMAFSDTGPLVDTVVARRAGIGFIGKNGLLITETFGSYVYLGYLLCDLKLEVDLEIGDGCGECNICIDRCPTKALFGNKSMDAKKCLSFQTQKRGVVQEPYRSKMGKMLYGCDICQKVCPYNFRKDFHLHREMEPYFEDVAPELAPLLHMNKRTFRARFGYMAGAWRGVHQTRRNALIAIRNLGAIELVPDILLLLETEQRLEVRVTALEAIKHLTGQIPAMYHDEIECYKQHEIIEIAQAYQEL